MKESEYIAATNLAKLRIARAAVADCLGIDGQRRTRVLYTLDEMVADHEAICTLDDSTTGTEGGEG